MNTPKYPAEKPIEIDLHGMRLDEARILVRARLSGAQTGELFHFIVGRGTTRGVSVLGPAIKQLIVAFGYSWRPARLADGGEGRLVVTIR